MRDKMEPAPNSVATRSKLKRPTRPQFKPPTISRMSVIRFKGFIVFFMRMSDAGQEGGSRRSRTRSRFPSC